LLVGGWVFEEKRPTVLGELRAPGAADDLTVVLDLEHGHLAGQAVGHWSKPQDAVAGHEPLPAVHGAVRPFFVAIEEWDGVNLCARVVVAEPGNVREIGCTK
jgi:hypothetical protein